MAQARLPEPPATKTSAVDDVSSDGESPGDLAALRSAVMAWREGPVKKTLAKMPARKPRFST